jgi:hypothetical protein
LTLLGIAEFNIPFRGSGMGEPCFIKKNSNPYVCGIHNVRLVEHQSTDDLAASRFDEFTYLVCPKSGQVLNDQAGGKMERT